MKPMAAAKERRMLPQKMKRLRVVPILRGSSRDDPSGFGSRLSLSVGCMAAAGFIG